MTSVEMKKANSLLLCWSSEETVQMDINQKSEKRLFDFFLHLSELLTLCAAILMNGFNFLSLSYGLFLMTPAFIRFYLSFFFL